ncbi:hypothetical protein [Pseudochryseolinea flava]|uniref:Uncharacterized protein n=1 Tax=Pseudochryseolinea flava TaxID=2059302 RepID=A0A364XVE0_9BACT|nr:hypothetical protein [Pseudochryseolinea flava]RAV98317.1 hypothetical protein DQQ10_24525 [Pseudochryseolinea flava]
MNQQPDKLFRDKLEQYQRTAPAPAWDRIEQGLDKKNKPAWLWLRIAAAILFLAVGTWFFWPSNATIDQSQQMSDKNKSVPKKVLPPVEKDLPKEQQPKDIEPVGKKSPSSKEIQENINTSPVIKKKETHEEVEQLEEVQTPLHASNNVIKEIPTQENTTAIEPKQDVMIAKVEDQQNIKLVYSANAADKYLKKTVPSEATTETKKTSRLQRLLDKAEDLKTNQDPIGEFRQAKNEILALNFRSEKDREQNK